jgi:hypothetical protein
VWAQQQEPTSARLARSSANHSQIARPSPATTPRDSHNAASALQVRAQWGPWGIGTAHTQPLISWPQANILSWCKLSAWQPLQSMPSKQLNCILWLLCRLQQQHGRQSPDQPVPSQLRASQLRSRTNASGCPASSSSSSSSSTIQSRMRVRLQASSSSSYASTRSTQSATGAGVYDPRKKVVVVGGGWAGFGAAKHLAEQGYAVTLLEAAKNPGGLSAGACAGVVQCAGVCANADGLTLTTSCVCVPCPCRFQDILWQGCGGRNEGLLYVSRCQRVVQHMQKHSHGVLRSHAAQLRQEVPPVPDRVLSWLLCAGYQYHNIFALLKVRAWLGAVGKVSHAVAH